MTWDSHQELECWDYYFWCRCGNIGTNVKWVHPLEVMWCLRWFGHIQHRSMDTFNEGNRTSGADSLRLEFSWVVKGYFRHYRDVEVEFSLNFKVLHFSVCWIFFLLRWIMKYKFTVCWWCIHKERLFYFSFLFLFHILALLHLFIYFIFHCFLLAGISNNNRCCIIV